MANQLTYAEVTALLKYDPESGVLTWLVRSRDLFKSDRNWKIWNTKNAGKEAFTARTRGYKRGLIVGHWVSAHRVAWLLHYGSWPEGDVDHLNGIRSDNRIANLRDASRTENMRNAKLSASNTSGFTGVSWFSARRKWVASVTVGGKHLTLGYFSDKNDAITARRAANEKYGFTERHGTTG